MRNDEMHKNIETNDSSAMEFLGIENYILKDEKVKKFFRGMIEICFLSKCCIQKIRLGEQLQMKKNKNLDKKLFISGKTFDFMIENMEHLINFFLENKYFELHVLKALDLNSFLEEVKRNFAVLKNEVFSVEKMSKGGFGKILKLGCCEISGVPFSFGNNPRYKKKAPEIPCFLHGKEFQNVLESVAVFFAQ